MSSSFINIIKGLFSSGKPAVAPGQRDSKLDVDQLLASADLNSSIIALDNYICALCGWGDNLDALTDQQLVFYFNQELEREINNGGFEQYFINSSGMYANETVSTLELIGANKTADILRSAIDLFPQRSVPADSDQREAIVNEIKETTAERWDELDRLFFKYEDDLNSLNMAFVRQYKEYF